MEWEVFFNDLSSFLQYLSGKEHEANSDIAESVLEKISSYIYVLLNVKATLQEGDCHGDEELVSVQTMVSSLIKDMEDIKARWALIEAGIKSVFAPRISDGSRGRPKVIIEPEKIQFLRELNFTWTKIADIFGVSRRTLYNIRSEFGMIDEQRFVRISDHDLCYLVGRIKRDMPEIGYNMMRGLLQSQGIHVSIPRIQQCIREVDPINTAMRWAVPTYRRQYQVPHPNYIWHLDGNHKLIRCKRKFVCTFHVITLSLSLSLPSPFFLSIYVH